MIINHNLMANNAIRNMNINSGNASNSMQKLSSGLRINKAGDDAAGLAISEKMRGQIRGLDQASSNSQDAISLIQTGEGALNETHSILQRMRELAVQSSSDTNKDTDRSQIQGEMDQLATEITRISNDTEFNQKNLLAGNLNDTYQVGANSNQNIKLSIGAMDAETLGVASSKTATTGTVGANLATATFTGKVGDKIVDGASVTLKYVAGSAAVAATPATSGTAIQGTAAAAANLTTGGTLALTIDSQAFNVTLNNGDNQAAILSAINTAANTKLGTTGQTYATIDGAGKLNIQSLTTGTTSEASVTGIAGTMAADLHIAVAAGTAGTAGTVGTPAVADHIQVSDGTATQNVAITDKNATSFAVAGGNFSGLKITTASGKALKDLNAAASDTITVAQTITNSSKATFKADGTVDQKAVAAAGIDVSSQTAANTAITTINNAIETVSTERAKLGAYQNRLEHTIANLGTSSENLTSAESRIRDVDMAKEMSNFSKNNILSQAAQAMLAQANQQPQQVLQLLR